MPPIPHDFFPSDPDIDTAYAEQIEAEIKSELQSLYPEKLDPEFRIFSSIRYDPDAYRQVELWSATPMITLILLLARNFLFIKEHYTRLIFSLRYFEHQFPQSTDNEQVQLSYAEFLEKLNIAMAPHDPEQVYRLRASLSLTGELTVDVFATPPVADLFWGLDATTEPLWDVYLDPVQIAVSLFTLFKTNRREHYTAARNRCLPGLKPEEEVLLWNGQDMVMEGSITNIAIFFEGRWVTPPLSLGCLCGVTRHWLLRQKLIEERPISVSDIELGQTILLFNAVRGVMKGKVVLRPELDVPQW